MTVLFADVSGYTSVAERLDPETVKSLIERCLTGLAAEVERYGGRIDKFIGDSVMAVFGAPVSHENDPERAVRASIGMQKAMIGFNESIVRAHGFELALRIGVNTGEVLAGRLGDAYTVIGDTVNVAARLAGGWCRRRHPGRRSHPESDGCGGRVPARRPANAEGQA